MKNAVSFLLARKEVKGVEACLATFIVAVLGKLVGHLLCKLTDVLMEHHSNRNKRKPK